MDIVERYSNSILGEYFEKLIEKKIKISYKPQRVELLSEVYSGKKVKDLIKKSDDISLSKELISKLEMNSILDRNVEELSGGELQKLAIVACLTKNAEVYYLDEPMSFLDITTRINVARLIRSLKKSIIVVEHDLTSLDYISDEVQIVYGERGAYGIFSQSKSVRNGINEYLDGYIKSDNVKFRDYAIKFNEAPPNKTKTSIVLFEFPEMEKKFENFELKVEEGKINRGEVIGVVGANGLGKSTFLKLITGQEKADKGKVEKIKYLVKKKLAKHLGIWADNLVIANGSNVLIQALVMATSIDRNILTFDPTFSVYELEANLFNNTVVRVPLNEEDFSIPEDLTLRAIKKFKPSLIFIANPNAPTGNLFDISLLKKIIAIAPGLVVIDEAQRKVETSQIVKGWFDAQLPVKVILLGSSSLNLLNQHFLIFILLDYF